MKCTSCGHLGQGRGLTPESKGAKSFVAAANAWIAPGASPATSASTRFRTGRKKDAAANGSSAEIRAGCSRRARAARARGAPRRRHKVEPRAGQPEREMATPKSEPTMRELPQLARSRWRSPRCTAHFRASRVPASERDCGADDASVRVLVVRWRVGATTGLSVRHDRVTPRHRGGVASSPPGAFAPTRRGRQRGMLMTLRFVWNLRPRQRVRAPHARLGKRGLAVKLELRGVPGLKLAMTMSSGRTAPPRRRGQDVDDEFGPCSSNGRACSQAGTTSASAAGQSPRAFSCHGGRRRPRAGAFTFIRGGMCSASAHVAAAGRESAARARQSAVNTAALLLVRCDPACCGGEPHQRDRRNAGERRRPVRWWP